MLNAPAALMAGAALPGLPSDARPGLLHMLKQPARAAADAHDAAGRGMASSAALLDASKHRAADSHALKPHGGAAPGGATGAPASGSKAFIEAAKRTLDKAEYAQARALQPRHRHALA